MNTTTAILFDKASNTWCVPNTQMEVEVILASKSTEPKAQPIYTIRMRYPRIIHAEVMTHRVFSRNARSSRAVPVAKMIEEVRKDPFVPWHWGKNQKGMQAGEECNEIVRLMTVAHDTGDETKVSYSLWPYSREAAWLSAGDKAVEVAEAFMNAGYHKQICNRLLEPFMYIDVLITATEWNNFLWLRDHKDAEPHLEDLARLVKQAIDSAEFQKLPPGYWHLPYIKPEEYRLEGKWAYFEEQVEFLQKISAARCARISYAPFDGDATYEKELQRYDSLVKSDRVHASPLEHQAMPDKWIPSNGYREGFWEFEGKHGNLSGWIQNRKLIPNESKTA